MAKAKTSPAQQSEPAGYTVVARRYRPQQFSELIGQEHVAGALVNALNSGRIAHAYLFTGARGVGKTSAARVLAKALNCLASEKPTATPCDKCASCIAITAGDDVDVLEIDGASNNKVEEVRDLRAGVGFRPTRGRFKIYIIDEVHMLSTSAFNALLKTLEEPPEHVKFILATTEAQKIPITILSRCQRFDFAHVGSRKIFEHLKRISEREGHKADDDALKLVARRAAGSMRDSQSLLDQLLASCDGHLTAAHVAKVLGTAGEDRVCELATSILANDARSAFDLISLWVDQGVQVGELVDQLVEYWRALMLMNCGGADVRELPLSPNQSERIANHAKSLTLDAILGGLEVLTATKSRLRGSTHTQVLLEMAVVRLAQLCELQAVADLLQTLTQPGEIRVETSSRTVLNTGDGAKKNGRMPTKPTANSNLAETSGTIELTDSSLRSVWELFLSAAAEKSPILAKNLRFVSSYAIFGPNSLAIRFPAGYHQAYVVCANEANAQRLQDVLRRVLGQTASIRFELDRTATTPVDLPPVPETVTPASDRKKTLTTLPLFKKAAEALGAQVWHVDEEFNHAAVSRHAQQPAVTEIEHGTEEG